MRNREDNQALMAVNQQLQVSCAGSVNNMILHCNSVLIGAECYTLS